MRQALRRDGVWLALLVVPVSGLLMSMETRAGATADGDNLTSAVPGGMHRAVQVVVMVMSPPDNARWRQMVRDHQEEATSNVTAIGHSVNITVRFAVGKSLDPFANERCRHENDTYGDLAILDVRDGVKRFHSKGQHNGKIWHVFKWALGHFPDADLFFKQDDDNIVNWRVALPTMLGRLWRQPVSLPLERMYMGRLQYEEGMYPCGMGELYGFSKDIVMFGLTISQPTKNFTEDVFTCQWSKGFEAFAGPWSIDRGGLLRWPDYENAWIHPVKKPSVYADCFRDRVKGCAVTYPWGEKQQINFRLLSSVEAARAVAGNATPETRL